MFRSLLIFIFLFSPSVFAEQKSESLSQVQSIFKRYWGAESVFMSVNKKAVYGLLGGEKNYKGRLLFAKGRLRIDFIEPEESTVVFNKKNIIAIKKIKKSKEVKTYVTIIDKKKAGKENALMGLLFGDAKVWSDLKLVKEKKIKDRVSLHFVPKDPKKLPAVTRVAIVFDKVSKEIIAIKQWDDIDNEVQFEFASLIFDIGYPKDTFDPSWPKTAIVTRF